MLPSNSETKIYANAAHTTAYNTKEGNSHLRKR